MSKELRILMRNLIAVLLLAVWAEVVYAMKIQSIYEAEVPVSSQDERQRAQAIQQAFTQTLNKMSGGGAVLQNPAIQAAMAEAKNKVEEFSYAPSGLPGTPFLLKVKFDPKAMKSLLRQAKEPIWDENRPLILVWLAVENAAHTFEVLDSQSTNEFALVLKKTALQRGLPILLPMMDIAELNGVSTADIRAKSLPPLQKASERYHADGTLVGSIEVKDKLFAGHWRLTLGGNHWDWDLSSETIPGLMQALGNKLVTILAGRYAAVQTETVSSSLVLIVKGIGQQDDYENLLRLIKRISLVRQMEIENVLGDEVILRLDVQGAQQAFMQEASVGQHLQLQIEKENELTYLWVR